MSTSVIMCILKFDNLAIISIVFNALLYKLDLIICIFKYHIVITISDNHRLSGPYTSYLFVICRLSLSGMECIFMSVS